MAKIATITDKHNELDAKAVQIDIKNIRQAINDLNDEITNLKAIIAEL
jgi:uncharacterized protein YdcH (DUF465 family)